MDDCKGSVRKPSQANGSPGFAFALNDLDSNGGPPTPLRSNGHLQSITHVGGSHMSPGRYKYTKPFGTSARSCR
jgi:hypothetical protein